MADNTHTLKQAARGERLERAAARARQEADSRVTSATAILSCIPPGQPILVGHHSEKRHRHDLQRVDTHMRKAIEAADQAAEFERRAAAVGTGGISSDDPDAIEALREKLAQLMAKRDRMKVLNALHRKQGTLHETDFLAPEERSAVLANLRFSAQMNGGRCMVPYPTYTLTNISARIRDVDRRIEELSAHVTAPAPGPEQIGDATVTADPESNRVLLAFPARLSPHDYRLVRQLGFVWSPTRRAFVRKLSGAALAAARTVAQRVASAPVKEGQCPAE